MIRLLRGGAVALPLPPADPQLPGVLWAEGVPPGSGLGAPQGWVCLRLDPHFSPSSGHTTFQGATMEESCRAELGVEPPESETFSDLWNL